MEANKPKGFSEFDDLMKKLIQVPPNEIEEKPMVDDGEDIRAGDGWKRGPERYTLTERVRGQIASMRREALAQGGAHFEPFFRDVETLCNMADEQTQQDRIDKANFKAGD